MARQATRWGHLGFQHGNLMANALECADRLVCAFCQMRNAKLIQD